MRLREDCEYITARAIAAVQPDAAVRRALEGKTFADGRLILIAIGKAAWSMASAARQALGERVSGGLVITKYGHARGDIPGLAIHEAGHPVPDGNSSAPPRRAEPDRGLRGGYGVAADFGRRIVAV
jgi:hydroxypyruvate reductase